MADRCKNITFPQLHLQAVKIHLEPSQNYLRTRQSDIVSQFEVTMCGQDRFSENNDDKRVIVLPVCKKYV